MTYFVGIKGLSGTYLPADEKADHILVGEYLKLPNGKIFLYKSDNPNELVEVEPAEVVEGKRVIPFKRYSPNG